MVVYSDPNGSPSASACSHRHPTAGSDGHADTRPDPDTHGHSNAAASYANAHCDTSAYRHTYTYPHACPRGPLSPDPIATGQ